MTGITVIDFETFYSQDYTLKKMTTEAYIRDSRFKAHLCAVWTPEERSKLVPPTAEALNKYVTGRTVIAQKAQFDGLILSHHFGLKPQNWICTLSMARATLPQLRSHSLESLAAYYGLPAKTIDYKAFIGKVDLDAETYKMLSEGCLQDVSITLDIAKRLLKDFPKAELPIVDATIRMFTEPRMCLDAPMASAELERIKLAKKTALEQLGVAREELQSADKFSALITACGVEVPMKQSPRVAGKMIPAIAKTDQGMKDLAEHSDIRVAALAQARLGEKSTIMETRLERLIEMNGRGPLCLYLNYWGAGNTGRWSGGDKVNAQNFPPAIQRALVAPEGFKFVKTDSAQIECRILNYFAGQEDITNAFREGQDLYSEGASRFYGRPITKANKIERHLGKVLELGCGYRMGWEKLRRTCALGALGGPPIMLDEYEARNAIALYRSTHPKVVELWKKYDRWLDTMYRSPKEDRTIKLPNGTFLDWSDLRYDGNDYYRGEAKVHGGVVVENIIQALGRVFVSDVMLRLRKLYPHYWLALCTHDDLVNLVPENDAQAADNIAQQFKIAPSWAPELPLSADSYEGKRYSR